MMGFVRSKPSSPGVLCADRFSGPADPYGADPIVRYDGGTSASAPGPYGGFNEGPPASTPGPVRQFRARTIVIPIVFLLAHLLIVNVTAVLFVVIAALTEASRAGQAFDPFILLDMEFVFEQISRSTTLISVVYALILIPVYVLFLTLARKKHPDAVWMDRPRLSFVAASCVIMTGAMGLTNLYFLLLNWLSGRSGLVSRLMDEYIELSGNLSLHDQYLWLILGIGILAPIAEELLFRGIIQGELRRAMPEWLAIIIQALLFSAFHMQPVQSVYVIVPGLLLGMAYAWSGTLWVPIIMHILFNLLGSLVPGLVQDNQQLGGIVALIEIAFIPIGIIAGIFFYRNRRGRSIPGQSRSD